MLIAKFLNTGQARAKLHAVLDSTSAFLFDPNKEAKLKAEGKQPDPKILDQYSIFDEYMPVEMSDDFRVLEYLVDRNMAIASVIAAGQEIPRTRGGKLITVEGEEMCKIAISLVFNERDEIRMLELSKMQGMPQGFVEMLYGSIDSLQPRNFKAANVLTSQLWVQGFVDYTDSRSGTAFRLRYITLPELFPPPLLGATPGTAPWNDYVNGNGILNLQEHAAAFYGIHGFYPDETVMSKSLFTQLVRQDSTRDHAMALGLITNNPNAVVRASISKEMLGKICSEYDIPPIRVWDAQYEIEIAPGQNIRGRYIPSHSYCFLTKGMGKRIYGPTIENQGKPGIYTKVEEELKSSPPESRGYAVSRMIPFINKPEYLASRKVA